MGDTLGLLAVYIVGILLFIAGGVILTVAVSELTFIMGRIVQGFGGELFSPIVPVLLTSILSERPGKILIIWGSVAGIIAAFAPILGGPLISQYGWKTAFYIIAGLSVISLFTLQQKYLQNSKVETFLLSDYRDLFSLQNIWLLYGYIFLTTDASFCLPSFCHFSSATMGALQSKRVGFLLYFGCLFLVSASSCETK